MSAITTLFPPLKWAQRPDLVLLTVELQDSKDVRLQLPKDGAVFSFSCTVPAEGGSEKHYACEFEFFKPVSPEESDFVVRPRQIEIKLQKKIDGKADDDDEDAFWPRLGKDKSKNKNIAIDWARWKDEDDGQEGDDGDLGDFGLGGMGGMGGEGDDEEFTQKMLQQFAVKQGVADAEAVVGEGIPAFGSAQGQGGEGPAAAAAAEEEEDDDMPGLEEDN